MDPGSLRDLLTVLAGVATGALSAAFGVGGAVVSTPAIRALGASAAVAVGTTLPSILPSAATGTLQYSRAGLIDWRMVAWTAPAGVVAAVGGSLLSKVVPGDGHWLMVLTAALLGVTAWRMAGVGGAEPGEVVGQAGPLGATETEEAFAGTERPDRRDNPRVLSAIGAVAGLLSGLLGVGGGIVMVPAFSELAGIPIKTAIATSLACVGVFAVPGTITHALFGDIDWRFALWLAVGVVPGARLGARAAIRATDRRLRLAVAGFLGVVSVLYAAGELISLAR
jgi:uncharacterized membrane protein YfcA